MSSAKKKIRGALKFNGILSSSSLQYLIDFVIGHSYYMI